MTPSSATELPPARRVALETVRRAEHPSADLQSALDGVLKAVRPTRQDAALATELAYGYFRHRDRLSFILDHYFAKPGGIPEPVRQTLSLAAYELLFLDRVPDYAAVDWAVEHVKHIKPGLAGVANAVLRNVSRLGSGAQDEAFYARDNAPRAQRWAWFYSCPRWIVELWEASYGPEATLSRLRAGLSRPPVGVRVNAVRPGADELLDELCAQGRPVLRLPMGAALDDVPLEYLETLVEQGRITRQSAAGQQAMLALGAESWPGPVWDVCAGRGGKAGWLAEQASGKAGRVWASDSHIGRLRGLGREMARLGLPVHAFRAKAQEPAPLRSSPGTILLDAPCSGLGVLSRRPDSRYKRTPDDLPHLVKLQGSLLSRAADNLASGGLLAYVTCTMHPGENEGQVQNLLASRSDLTLAHEFSTDPASPLREFFYAAALRKS